MPLKLNPVTSLNLFGVKKNFQSIARNAQNLKHPTNATHLTSAPALEDLEEMQEVYVLTGGTMYKYANVNNTLYRWAFTAA